MPPDPHKCNWGAWTSERIDPPPNRPLIPIVEIYRLVRNCTICGIREER